ncbi:MAG: SLC13 family permease [Bifidobacteriaceae bacterium]|nr:SLC13 family permease [Bifidobacteriaceae bacterium]
MVSSSGTTGHQPHHRHILPMPNRLFITRRRIGLFLGPILAVVVYFLLPTMEPKTSYNSKTGVAGSAVGSAGEHAGALVAAILVLMAVWWMTEVFPLYVTALLPLVAFPLCNITSFSSAAAPYASSTIFLFFGGFVLAASMERWNLHRRVAIWVLLAVGSKPRGIVFGFMAATSFLSLWVSNTATAVMMLPIAMSVLKLVERVRGSEDKNFRISMVLSIAYGASIGSFGTPIASPPNGIALGYLKGLDDPINITFGQWMAVGIPLWIVALVVAWFLLTFVVLRPAHTEAIPGHREVLQKELRSLGAFKGPERRVGVIFLCTAFAWIFHGYFESWFNLPISALTDEVIAIAVVFVLFLCPISFKRPGHGLMTWADLRGLSWGILYLFGGGLSMAAQVDNSGLAEWIGAQAKGIDRVPVFVLLLACCALTWIITEFMSNTAAASVLVPIFGLMAMDIGRSPVFLAIPVAMAASCAFMMPAGTPPNAVAYSSGMVSINEMNKAGFLIAIASIFLVTTAMFTYGIKLLGVG